MITHRLENVIDADIIYVLGKEGTIIEKGTHQDLMSYDENSAGGAGGVYRKLVMEMKRNESGMDGVG